MANEISIRSNIKEVVKGMAEHARQIPFAAAGAINDATKDARSAVIKDVESKQHGGKKWWNNRETGILREFAKKTQLWGSIFTRQYWSGLQSEGGTKTPFRGKSIAVPQPTVAKANRKSGGIKKVLGQKGVFVTPSGVYKRKGRKGAKTVEPLFVFAPKAVIPKAKGVLRDFGPVIERTVGQKFSEYFQKRWEKAVSTARK